MKKITILFIVFLSIGCSTQSFYTGVVLNCDNEPIGGIEVRGFHDTWWLFSTYPIAGRTKSESDGRFELTTNQPVVYLTTFGGGDKVLVDGNPKISIDNCNVNE